MQTSKNRHCLANNLLTTEKAQQALAETSVYSKEFEGILVFQLSELRLIPSWKRLRVDRGTTAGLFAFTALSHELWLRAGGRRLRSYLF